MKFIGVIFQHGSGSVGGITASTNKGGPYLKVKASPTNPNSTRQQVTRALLGMFASRWTTYLVQAQRDQWNTYAQSHTIKDSLGADIFINGNAWYIMFNTRIADFGGAAIDVPPAGAGPSPLTTMIVTLTSPASASVAFTPTPTGAAEEIQLWQTLPGTTGQTPNEKQARLVGYSTVAQASPYVATLPFSASVGEQVTFYGRIMNADGQVSVSLVDTAIAI